MVGWIFFEKDIETNNNLQQISLTDCGDVVIDIFSAETPYGVDGVIPTISSWSWQEVGWFEYDGDLNTPTGSGVLFEQKRHE